LLLTAAFYLNRIIIQILIQICYNIFVSVAVKLFIFHAKLFINHIIVIEFQIYVLCYATYIYVYHYIYNSVINDFQKFQHNIFLI